MGRPMKADSKRALGAYLLALVTILLAIASFTSRGTGIGGAGMMMGMLWSYVFLAALLVAVLGFLWPRAEPPRP